MRWARDVLGRIEARVSEAAGYGAMNQAQIADFAERSLLLQGNASARALPRGQVIGDLSEVEFRVFSQWGEDGIIDWLVSHIPVPNTRFVEFGVETFREANCRFLLQNRNWKGLVMDGSEQHLASLQALPLYWMFDLTAKPAFVTAENINQLIEEAGFAGPLGILSVDIDGNDYWVWKAIDIVDPAIVICEYNPTLGDTRPVTVPYKPDFTRFDGHHSGLYFGSSIAALKHLAKAKGYTFLGTNSNGINAFFVKDALADKVLPLLKEQKAFPSRHRDSRDEAGNLSFTGGAGRFSLIEEMPVVDVETGETLQLKEIAKPYSDAWLKAMY